MLVVGGGITGVGRRARRGEPRVCAPRSSNGTTSRRARRRSRRSSCTAASATSSRRRSASSTRRSPSARSCATPRRTSCACCPFLLPGVHHATACSPAASRACSAPRCGRTTSPAACASASCTSASRKEEALRYMPTLHADNVAASYVYYDAQTDDARLTLTVARTAADYGAAVANYTTLVELREGRRRPRHRRARHRRRQRRSTCGPSSS